MSSLLLISLLTALGAAYFYLNVSEEIPRIMALTIVAICFILDLALAPWPIQLLILMLVLIATRNVSVPNQRRLG
jgi:hypothetical protein